jgi:uncharacterized protein YjbI with pentapeptide repeats
VTGLETRESHFTEPRRQPACPISLLDLAEILDQHKIWVESGGESGAQADLSGVDLSNAELTGVNLESALLNKATLCNADLSMANLRGASLIQADLRGANLLGTELRGANLMGATLFTAEGLWLGRVGGANLFDTLLPESASNFDSAETIAVATRQVRWYYGLMLGCCAVCLLLVAGTSDVRLLLNGPAVAVPRVGNLLPLNGFYLGAPILLLVVFLRFQFLLLRLWGSMASLPAVFPDGQTVEHGGPWYLTALVRKHFRWLQEPTSPLPRLEAGAANFLAYWAVPATLAVLWLRYLVRQNLRDTLLQVLLIAAAAAIAAGVPAFAAAVIQTGKSEQAQPQPAQWFRRIFTLKALKRTRPAAIAAVIFGLLSLGVIRGLPADRGTSQQFSPANYRRWASQIVRLVGFRAYADLTESALSSVVARPADADDEAPVATGPSLTPAAAESTDPDLAHFAGAHLDQSSLRYAHAYRVSVPKGKLWRANLQGGYFTEADFRGANLREALFADAVFDRARMAHLEAISSDGRRAIFDGADLRAADFSYSVLEEASFTGANLSSASFYGVNLREAQFARAAATRTDMRDVHAERSAWNGALLEQTDLSSAKLAGATFVGAQFKGTILLDADLSGADLRGAALPGAILRDTQIAGANLSGADLRGAIGLTAAQLCSAQWQNAVLDPDILASTQLQCGTPPPAGSAVPAPPPVSKHK